MNARKLHRHELTPEARLERAKRQIADGVAEMIEAKIAAGVAAGEWVDQDHSPLGKRAHLELAREGRLRSRKVKRQVLIRRDELNAFIEKEGLARGDHEPEDDVDAIVDTITRGGKR